MLKRIINHQTKSITAAAVIIGVLSLVSRFLGIFRDHILAAEFGAGDILDAYYAAFRLPDFVYNLLILGAVSAGLVPIFSSLLAKKENDKAWQLINDIFNILAVALFITCAILFFGASFIVPLITPGFTGSKSFLVIELSRIMFLSPLILGLSTVFSSVLQSTKKFFIYSLAPIFYNIGIIIGALYFVKWWGPMGLAWGVVLGAIVHFIIQMPAVFSSGYRYRPSFNIFNKEFLTVIRLTAPRTLSLMVGQINFLVITVFASVLAAGSLSIFNLSNNLQGFPLGVFGISMAVAALPILSELFAQKNKDQFVSALSSSFRQVLFFLLPASALLYVLRAQIVRILLGSGNFNWENTRLTAACLAVFCVGLFAQGTYPLIIRAFYAIRDTKTPFYVGLLAMLTNVLFLFIFRWLFSFKNAFSFFVIAILRLTDLIDLVDFRILALPSAIVVSAAVELVILLYLLRHKIGRLDGYRIINSTARILLASLGAGLFTYGTLQVMDRFVATQVFLGILAQGFFAGLVGLGGYWLIGYMVNMEEMGVFVAAFKKKMFKLFRAEKTVLEDDVMN